MPDSLIVYRINPRTLPTLTARFPSAFTTEKEIFTDLFLVETPTPGLQLIMTEEALHRSFDAILNLKIHSSQQYLVL